jgi:hypothetical protein
VGGLCPLPQFALQFDSTPGQRIWDHPSLLFLLEQ